jgi:hypothetical protein
MMKVKSNGKALNFHIREKKKKKKKKEVTGKTEMKEFIC